MFSGMNAYSAQISYSGGMTGGPPPMAMPAMPPPPPPTMMGTFRGYGGYMGGPTAGAYGEHLSGRMASMGQTGVGLAGAGMGLLGAAGSLGLIGGPMGAAASMMDPVGLAMRAGMGGFSAMGGGMGGLAAGGLAAGAVALPMYAGAAFAGGLARNFTGGMQDQMGLNSVLRQNFQFQGGQGAFGRGFGQQQMGQIGGMVSQELRNNVFTSAGELNSVIGGGAQMGAFSGVRDVQDFSRKFKEMLTTLKTVQRELGGNLTDAMEFVSQSRQAGIFGGTSATRFAGTIRTVSAATGFDQGQLIQLAANGAQIARAVGGRGEQGAHGALRGISTVSAALQGGMISEGMLSEATGGRTGSDAMQQFVTDMMQRTARFTRTGHGRFSIFGLSNRDGTGLDEGAMNDFMMGDMGASALSQRAHQRVNQMGRAQAINREGLLRGAALEQGGLGYQLGAMRQIVGDRAMDQGDDMMSLVMQRRMHMSRPQAEIMTSLMRNQATIATREASDAAASGRETALRDDVRTNRSADAFMRHLEHSVQDSTGMLKARDMGRSFVTRISSLSEKIMNDMLGITSDQMTTEGQRSMSRLRQGRASASDLSALGFGEGGFAGGRESFDINSRGLLEHGPSVGDRLRARGVETSSLKSFGSASTALRNAQLADQGIVSGADVRALRGLNSDVSGNSARLMEARLAASGSGNADDIYSFMGGSGNATAAFMAQHGIHNDARADGLGRLMGRGGSGRLTAGMFGRDALRLLGVGAASLGTAGLAAGVGLAAFGGAGGDNIMTSEVMRAMRDPQADSLDFLARGGHTAGRIGRRMEFGRNVSDMERGLHARMTGLSREDMQGLRGNGEFMSRLRAATEAGTAGDRQAALERMTSFVNSQDAGTSTDAMASVVTQMRDGLSRNGQFGSEIRGLAADPEARKAAQRAVEEYATSMQQIGRRGGGRGGGILRRMGEAALSGDRDQVLAAQRHTRNHFNRMGEEEYREFANNAMDVGDGPDRDRERAEARAAIMGISHNRAIDRDLRGEGRRGGRGAYETAIGEMTGYSTGSMEFEVGGRSVSGRRAQSLLQGAMTGRGGNRSAILEQFRNQMQDPNGLGLNEKQSMEMQNILTGSMSRRGANGAFTAADRERMSEFTSRGDIQRSMEEATQRRTEQALSSASARDPVGREQIRILGEISTTLRDRLTVREGGAAPDGATT